MRRSSAAKPECLRVVRPFVYPVVQCHPPNACPRVWGPCRPSARDRASIHCVASQLARSQGIGSAVRPGAHRDRRQVHEFEQKSIPVRSHVELGHLSPFYFGQVLK